MIFRYLGKGGWALIAVLACLIMGQAYLDISIPGYMNDMTDAIQEQEQATEQAYWDKFKKALEDGTAVNHRIKIREGANTYTGTIIEITARCIYVDLKDEYGRLLQHHARLPRNSPRFIIESFR